MALFAAGVAEAIHCGIPTFQTIRARKSPTTKTTTIAANSSSEARPPLKINGSPQPKQQPSLAEIQRAIGVDTDFNGTSPTSSSLLGSFATESDLERKLRESAEWMVDNTEAKVLAGQRVLLVLCMYMFPLWLLLLLVASGFIELPSDMTFWTNMIA